MLRLQPSAPTAPHVQLSCILSWSKTGASLLHRYCLATTKPCSTFFFLRVPSCVYVCVGWVYLGSLSHSRVAVLWRRAGSSRSYHHHHHHHPRHYQTHTRTRHPTVCSLDPSSRLFFRVFTESPPELNFFVSSSPSVRASITLVDAQSLDLVSLSFCCFSLGIYLSVSLSFQKNFRLYILAGSNRKFAMTPPPHPLVVPIQGWRLAHADFVIVSWLWPYVCAWFTFSFPPHECLCFCLETRTLFERAWA